MQPNLHLSGCVTDEASNFLALTEDLTNNVDFICDLNVNFIYRCGESIALRKLLKRNFSVFAMITQ